jgi:DNA repair protein RadC
MQEQVRSQLAPAYIVQPRHEDPSNIIAEERIIAQAIAILDSRVQTGRFEVSCPKDLKEYFRLKLQGRPAECFAVLWLDNRHRTICMEVLFHGTLDGASIYPREVLRAAITHNAAAAAISHNHPSGCPDPSPADRAITRELKDALAMIGTRLLDHIIVGESESVSMVERGLM